MNSAVADETAIVATGIVIANSVDPFGPVNGRDTGVELIEIAFCRNRKVMENSVSGEQGDGSKF